MLEFGDKRSQILQAAFKLFAEKGFYNTTVEEIAVEAGVGKGTVYEYFSSKKKLLQEMLFFASDSYFDRFPKKLEGLGELKAKLEVMAKLHFQFFTEHRDIARVVLFEHRYITEDLEDWLMNKEQGRIAYLVEIFQEAADKGEIRHVDFEVAARMVTGALWNMGVELVISSVEREGEGEHLANGVVDILWSGLSPIREAGG